MGFSQLPFVAGSAYTFSIYAKGTPGKQISLRSYDGITEGGSDNYTLTGDWQRFIYTFTISSSATSLSTYIRDSAGTAQTLYLDGCQLERKHYATSWMIGGTDRTAETMTIPTAAVLNANQGSIEVSAFIDPSGAHSVNNPNPSTIFALADVQDSPYQEKNQISIRRQPNSTTWYAYFSNSTGNIASITLGSITTAGWKSFAVTWQTGVGGSGYLNGINKGSVAANYLPAAILVPTANIGSWTNGTGQNNQIIDELRISNRLRTDTEVLSAYQSNQPLPVDTDTTCKLYFDDNPQAVPSGTEGTGVQPFWKYTSMNLGGGLGFYVNTFNLNLVLTKNLFQIPGRGIPISESITYNAQDTAKGPLGLGWHLGSDTSLTTKSDGSVVLVGSDGSIYNFTSNGTDGYTAPQGIYLTLEKSPAGNFKITDKSQNIYTYENGILSNIIDRNNNITIYTYGANGRLWKQTDPSGRQITYTYDSSGQLSSVSDPNNNTYSFVYQEGRLTTVTDPENNAINFGYNSSESLNTFTDSLSRVTQFEITDGKLQSYKDARTNGQDIYQTTFAQTTQYGNLVTTATDPENRVYTYTCDPSSGNLLAYSDSKYRLDYTWSNNNLMSVTDSKGTTSYEYDSKGNITKETVKPDSYGDHLMVKIMTYDDYNQLLTVVDGSGRKTSYKYDNKGNLLSTSNPNIKESNGHLYDQYGNVIQESLSVSANQNLLKNGSFETGGQGGSLSNWNRSQGNATVTLEGFNSHGNYALKMSSSTNTTDLFYQSSASQLSGKITLRADVKLDNVQNYGGSEGVIIKIAHDGRSDSWTLWGTGTVPMVLTPNINNSYVTVSIGLSNTKGTVWFDGIQLENQSFGGCLSSAYNSIENGGFESNLDNWSYSPGTIVQTPTDYS